MSERDPNTPINLGDETVVQNVVLPGFIDRTDIGFPINVINRIDGRVLGIATYYNGEIHQFVRGNGDFKTRPRVDVGVDMPDQAARMSILPIGLDGDVLSADAMIVSGDFEFFIPENTPVRWTIELSTAGEVYFERVVEAGVKTGQILIEGFWWAGDFKITAEAMGFYGEYIGVKIPDNQLSDIITVTVLDGLQLPAWAAGF